jgi:endonuclease/exonuclease/phosphatase family metal-dependent hydrolase
VVHVLDRRLGRPPRPASFPVFWPIVPLDRIWVHPRRALRRVFAHATPAARLASDHLPVVAELDGLVTVDTDESTPEALLVTAS